jgi:hypothetical protein
MKPAALRKESTPSGNPRMNLYLLHRIEIAIQKEKFIKPAKREAVKYACEKVFADDREAQKFWRKPDHRLNSDETELARRIWDRLRKTVR